MKTWSQLACLIMLSVVGCKTGEQESKKTFEIDQNKTVNVEDHIREIKTDMILSSSFLYIIDDYLLVVEMNKGTDKMIHLFNKNTFAYITSTGTAGEGEGEIINLGELAIDEKKRVFWAPDHSKLVMFRFQLDSVLANANYKPDKAFKLNHEVFMARFGILNDSITLGKAVRPTSSSTFEMMMAKLNFRTQQIEKYGYENPETAGKKSNSLFKLSQRNKVYVNAYPFCDLMTICNLDGTLRYNIYGPDKLENKDFRKDYFSKVDFFKDYIIAAYIGDLGVVTDKFKRQHGNLPSKFLIFDLNGNLKRIIETKHKFTFFCVDETNKRVIVHFADRDPPLGYFNLDQL
jgi:hypothetical protein